MAILRTEEIKEESEKSQDSNTHDTASEQTHNSAQKEWPQDVVVSALDAQPKQLSDAVEVTDELAEARPATQLSKKKKKKKKKLREKKISRLQTDYYEDETEEEKQGKPQKCAVSFTSKINTVERFNLDRIADMLNHLGKEDYTILNEECSM